MRFLPLVIVIDGMLIGISKLIIMRSHSTVLRSYERTV